MEASPEHPLTPDVAPTVTGVYALYWKYAFVYGGKALDVTLRRRLAQRHKKITGRRCIDVEDMTCKVSHRRQRMVRPRSGGRHH